MSCENNSDCACTYPCARHGKCCQCIKYHRERNELPACYFPSEAEKKYDRSLDNFFEIYKARKI